MKLITNQAGAGNGDG